MNIKEDVSVRGKDYGVVLECEPDGISAYVEGIDGCVATGDTREDVLMRIGCAIESHVYDDFDWDTCVCGLEDE